MKIVKPDEAVKDNDKNWVIEDIMAAEEVEVSGLTVKVCALQEKYRCASVEIPSQILAVVVLAKRCLDLNRQVTQWKQPLVQAEWKLQAASSVA